MTKQKRAQRVVTYIIGGLITCVMIAFGTLILAFALPSESAYDERSLATAQYLEQAAQPSPVFIRINQECMNDAMHCLWIMPEAITGRADAIAEMREQASTLTVSIDGRVRKSLHPLLIGSQIYVDLQLSSFGAGLHLVEVQIQDEDGRIYQHAWPARSETGTVTAPPTVAVPPTYSTSVP